MGIAKAHCFFEQSGTFKNQFRALGIEAEDYDILNDFEETDHVIDLFEQIRGGTTVNHLCLIRSERMTS